MQNSSIGAGISVRLTFCCPCSRGIWMFWTESSHCFHARGKMSYVPFPIRKHRFTVCQNVHCGFGWRIMRSGLGFVACYVREAGIRPDVGRGIFRRGTLRRMGSVRPGLPRRLYGNDLIGMSIGVAVGCGRRPPMGRHGSGVPLHERLIPRLAENWRSLRRVSYMELVGSVAAERPKLP